jgi:hypothetical protein
MNGGRKGGPIKGAMKHVDYVSGVVAEDYRGWRVAGEAGPDWLNGYRLFVKSAMGERRTEDKWKV